ncbi:alpha/beta hydrolase [uncultured Polaribacter sp.]|uniref:alpha/beta hydrolase n=1 Tax=uncultured Polaribacter sp. TaxID=174711 RepID=UPI0026128206|nr:alpha/beta hydrolase [uncultured Polaribacter sp.]
MKAKILIILLFTFKVSIAQKQFLNKKYAVSKRTYTYHKNKKKKLKLDFYKPKRIKKDVPLIVYVHGGSFSGGNRNDNNIVQFANEMAKRGFAFASVSYRLTMKKLGFGCQTKSEEKINAFNYASEDISLAVKYLLKNKKKFNIKTNKIILAGSSAGAEAILNLVYVFDNKILPRNFKFAGIISMAGAITTTENITQNNVIPIQLFHGTADKLVPYNIAPHHYCQKNDVGFLKLFGSKAIANRIKNINKSFYLYSINKGDHSWSGRPMHQCLDNILDFLYNDVLQKSKRQITILI